MFLTSRVEGLRHLLGWGSAKADESNKSDGRGLCSGCHMPGGSVMRAVTGVTRVYWRDTAKKNYLLELFCVHTSNAIETPTNSNFEAFGGPVARARWAQWPLRGSPWALKYPYCHQMITQTDPRGNRRVSEKVEM